MKKFICLVLCIALLSMLLVSCKNEEIGSYLEKYKDIVTSQEIEEMEFDMVILVGEGTADNAKDTVNLMINQYLEKFKTKLNIRYLTAAQYEEEATKALEFENKEGASADSDAPGRADIVLVTSKAMFDDLYERRLIADLTDFYDPTNSPYRSLNTQIAASLLSAVTIREAAYTKEGAEYIAQHKYCVPNNRILSSYDIFLLSIKSADYYNIGKDTFDSLTADEVAERVNAKIAIDSNPEYADGAIQRLSGNYDELSEYIASGEYYVKYSAPEVTREEAYESVFVIARQEGDIRHTPDWAQNTTQEVSVAYTNYYNRCMQVIFEFNNSVELRNLLQYGKLNTNYKFDKETGTVTHNDIADADRYYMDIKHTGDVFKAYYCESVGYTLWTADMAKYGEPQNKASIIAPEENATIIIEGEKQLIDNAIEKLLGKQPEAPVGLGEKKTLVLEASRDMTVQLPTLSPATKNLTLVWSVGGEDLGTALEIKRLQDDTVLNLVATFVYDDGSTLVNLSYTYEVVVLRVTAQEKLQREVAALNTELAKISTMDVTFALNTIGRLYTDVSIEWKIDDSETDAANHDFFHVAEAYEVKLSAKLTCNDGTDTISVDFGKTVKVSPISELIKVETEKNFVELDIPDKITADFTVQLPNTPVRYDDVTITWTLNGESYTDSEYTFTVGEEAVTVTLTATFQCGENVKVTRVFVIDYTPANTEA